MVKMWGKEKYIRKGGSIEKGTEKGEKKEIEENDLEEESE